MTKQRTSISEKLGRTRKAFVAVGLISCVVNLLMLTGPLFMLQVYDRVLSSRSVSTLTALLLLAVGLYMMMGLFDLLRTRILSRVAYWLDNELSPLTYRSWIARSIGGHSPAYRPIQDIGIVRGLISSPTILALFDLPWVPFYLGVIFLLHMQLGLLASAGALIVIILALLNEAWSSKAAGAAAQGDMLEARFADQAQKSADSVLSMGMLGNTQSIWSDLRRNALFYQQSGGERSEGFTATSKAFRLLLQSAILALGAYLAIHQEISAGMIVAASIIAGRALAPIDQTIGGWRMIKRAWLAYKRLQEYLGKDTGATHSNIDLPEPEGFLEVSSLRKHTPNSQADEEKRAILQGLNFSLKPGDGLGVIGPSASGKSSLAKLLVGLWSPDAGTVRLDGATFEQWDMDRLGKYIGYLPQHVALLPGTIAQNIARFDAHAKDSEVIEAAKLAGVHDMILSFPEGYGTNVDTALSPLTGGQTQRIALARAIFRKPKLIVLDEPNANLDQDGDTALGAAIRAMRTSGSVVIVMAHRPSAIAAVDKVLMLRDGHMAAFGSKNDVLSKVTRVA